MAELISSADNCHAFPLFLYQEAMLEGLRGTPNLASSELGETDPERALAYVYAVLYSPTYRRRYQGRLRTDLPRIPNCEDGELRSRLVDLGRELVALHLLELPRVAKPIRTYLGPKSPQVERVGWSDDTVWLDARGALRDRAGSVGFQGVPEAVWNFKVGSYQVCEKWLKDRTGQTLSKEEITRFERIVVATSETLRVMTEIDEVIEERGGWPSAFRR